MLRIEKIVATIVRTRIREITPPIASMGRNPGDSCTAPSEEMRRVSTMPSTAISPAAKSPNKILPL